MEKGPKMRFNEHKIMDKILDIVEKNQDIMEKTVDTLKNVLHYTWVGIYLLEGENLILKYYIGRSTKHTTIKVGQGICGSAIVDEQTVIVPDVSADKRYIACSAETKSEIVVPIWSKNQIIGEIDIDSDLPDAFDDEDKRLLERVAAVLGDVLG